MMEYKLVETSCIHSLKRSIKLYLRVGWKPQGGVSVYVLHEQAHYIQAMVRGVRK